MRRSVLVAVLAVLAVLATVVPASAAGISWTRQFGTTADDVAFGVATGPDGSVYVAGSTTGALAPAIGGIDAFVRKYTAGGAVVWTRQFGTAGPDLAYALATDAAGKVYVAGLADGSLDGQQAFGSNDAFVRALDANGALLWTHQFGTDEIDEAFGVDVDSAGNVYVVGETHGTLGGVGATIAGGVGTANLPLAADAFLVKVDAAGTEVWSRQFGTSTMDRALDVFVLGSGDAFVVGATDGALGSAPLGGQDAFLRAFDPEGAVRWTQQFGTTGDDEAIGVVVDGAGRAIVAGRVGGALPGQTALGGLDAFVRRFTAAGAPGLTRQFGTAGDDGAWDVAVDASKNFYVTGLAAGALPGRTERGGGDVFVRRYDAGGAPAWTFQVGSAALEIGFAAEVAPNGAVHAAGFTDGVMTGGTGAGGRDAFVLKVAQPAPKCTTLACKVQSAV